MIELNIKNKHKNRYSINDFIKEMSTLKDFLLKRIKLEEASVEKRYLELIESNMKLNHFGTKLYNTEWFSFFIEHSNVYVGPAKNEYLTLVIKMGVDFRTFQYEKSFTNSFKQIIDWIDERINNIEEEKIVVNKISFTKDFYSTPQYVSSSRDYLWPKDSFYFINGFGSNVLNYYNNLLHFQDIDLSETYLYISEPKVCCGHVFRKYNLVIKSNMPNDSICSFNDHIHEIIYSITPSNIKNKDK